MTSVAERQRRKKAQQQRAEEMGLTLTPTPKREPNGRTSRSDDQEYERTPDKVALNARCRQAGWKPTSDNRRKASAQSMEGQVGLMLTIATAERERSALWETYKALDAAEDRYARRILGKPRHAKTAKVEMEPQRLEARDDDRPDLRSDEEKDRIAVTNWMRWRGYLGHLDAWMSTAIFDGMLGRAEMVAGGKLTTPGERFLTSLRALHVVARSKG